MSEDVTKLLKIPIEDIEPSLFECREGSDLTELTRSIEKIGVIEPIIVRKKANGKYELVGGGRRVSASKCAGLKEILAIVRELSDEEAFVFQVSENLQRIDLTDEEKTKLVVFCAEKYKWKPKEIAQKISMSADWVYKYLPSQYKDQVKAEAGKVGGEVTQERKVLDAVKQNHEDALSLEQTVKTQDTALEQAALHKVVPKAFDAAEVKTCERCGVQTTEPKTWHGHTLCSHCETKADFNPAAYDGYFRYQERGKAGLIPKAKATVPAVDSWAHRAAQMKTPHSKMEEKIVNRLRAKGYTVETDIPVVVKEIVTVPDFNILLPSQKAVRGYVDGVVHNGKRRDRDDDLRLLLKQRYPNDKIVAVDVKGDSDKEADEKTKEIEEAMKW